MPNAVSKPAAFIPLFFDTFLEFSFMFCVIAFLDLINFPSSMIKRRCLYNWDLISFVKLTILDEFLERYNFFALCVGGSVWTSFTLDDCVHRACWILLTDLIKI